MNNYVYVKSEPQLYTVGFHRSDGSWEPESDWDSLAQAATRVHYLNGGLGESLEPLVHTLETIAKRLEAIENELELLRRGK
jgi:hypothetical protein